MFVCQEVQSCEDALKLLPIFNFPLLNFPYPLKSPVFSLYSSWELSGDFTFKSALVGPPVLFSGFERGRELRSVPGLPSCAAWAASGRGGLSSEPQCMSGLLSKLHCDSLLEDICFCNCISLLNPKMQKHLS